MSLDRVLFLFGIGFLAANVYVLVQYGLFLARRRGALLVWPPPRPAFLGVSLAIGLALGVLIVFNLLFQRIAVGRLFGEGMMFLYYACVFRLRQKVRLGFYESGIWTATGFMPYAQIDAVTWHDKPQVVLVLISRRRSLARRLVVPGDLYGAARRVLRDRIAAHALTLKGAGLGLGIHDAGEDV